MATTLTYGQLSDVPEGLREHATEKEGQYTVSVEFAGRVKEFRDNNVRISEERDGLKATLSQYEQVTGVSIDALEEGKLTDFADALTQLRETKQRVDDGKLVEETSLEEAAARRVQETHDNYRQQLADSAKERDAHKARADAAEQRANSMVVDQQIRIAASDPEVAMLDNAISMVIPQALQIFRVEDDGSVIPKANDGTIIYGHDGITPMTPKEWLLKQRDEKDFLFKGSRGGGASGGTSTESGKMSFAQMQKENMSPELRMQMARQGKA